MINVGVQESLCVLNHPSNAFFCMLMNHPSNAFFCILMNTGGVISTNNPLTNPQLIVGLNFFSSRILVVESKATQTTLHTTMLRHVHHLFFEALLPAGNSQIVVVSSTPLLRVPLSCRRSHARTSFASQPSIRFCRGEMAISHHAAPTRKHQTDEPTSHHSQEPNALSIMLPPFPSVSVLSPPLHPWSSPGDGVDEAAPLDEDAPPSPGHLSISFSSSPL